MGTSDSGKKPILLYDGKCDFCRFWVERWSGVTGDRVRYLPAGAADPDVPDIPQERLAESVVLILPSGEQLTGARAVFGALSAVPKWRWMLRLYESIPGAPQIAERCYAFVAGRRGVFSALTRFLWGTNPGPPSYFLTRSVFLKLLGLVYLIAFLSLASQMPGLIGKNGILPAGQFFDAVHKEIGPEAYWRIPSLGLLNASDGFFQFLCWGGAAASVLIIAGVAPALALGLSWLSYLSLVVAGQEFLSFQWDILLLETGFLAIFFAPFRIFPRLSAERPPSAVVIWLFRLLLFRLMFFSGYVKLASGDPSWRGLTTLTFHYETQPLPTPLGWYAHQLPPWIQAAACAIMFCIELAVPILFFAPRRVRIAACGVVCGFMILIMLTGNYTFFNLLTILLCLTLLDDAMLKRFLPRAWTGARVGVSTVPDRSRWIIRIVAAVIVFLNLVHFSRLLTGRESLPGGVDTAANWFGPFCIVNRYGLFAVMTNPRMEIILEGSNDGVEWREYEFKYKPGDVRRAPPWIEPHQPRLDWQMWFAALGPYQNNRWFVNLCVRLLQGSAEVRDLLGKDPFSGSPPRYIRAQLYEYHFTDYSTRRATGAWWRRELKGPYLPPISLNPAHSKGVRGPGYSLFPPGLQFNLNSLYFKTGKSGILGKPT